MTGLREWLASLQLESYCENLVKQRVDLDVLSDLTEADLADLGIPLGDRKRIMRAIEALHQREVQPPLEPTPPPTAPSPQARSKRPLLYEKEELRQLTLVFADLVGSTQLTHTLGIERYRDAIRTYQLCCSDLIRSHFGFVAQFLGDGVLAYFGYPTAEEDDAERAVSAALAIAWEVPRLEVVDHAPLAVRVGIATGDVLVSDLVGERLAIKGAVLGDAPNLAARLQALARPGQVIVAESTKRLLGRQFDCFYLGDKQIKGFDKSQTLWLVRGMTASPSRFSAHSIGPMTPLVGREDELKILQHRWDTTCRGEGQVILVSGEAGIGKSRLAEWLCDAIVGRQPYRTSYQCSPYHSDSPFFPIVMQLARAAGFSDDDLSGDRLDKLEHLLAQGTQDVRSVAPLFARLLSIPFEYRYGDIDQPPEVIKERTMNALLEQLFGLATRQPVVVFFEDLHWVDPSTEELLDLLVDRIGDNPVMLICTYRPDYEAPWIGRARVTHLSLSRLDRNQSLELVGRIASREELATDLLEQIVARADGVPLFLEELTKTILERPLLSTNGSEVEVALPKSLKELLMAKLDSLSSGRELVPLCAAIGRTFSYRLLMAVSEVSEETLLPILAQLGQAQILLHRGEYPDVTFTFRHALIQEAAYETMLASRVQALHARIADVLRTQFVEIAESRPEVVAQHLSRARRYAEARDQWRGAAVLAIARSANTEAWAHLKQALAENAKLEEGPERTAAEITLREMMREPIDVCAWGSTEIELNLRRLYELRAQQGDSNELFLVAYGSCGTHLLAGRIREAEADAERMAALAEETGQPVHDILTVHTRAFLAFLAGYFSEAVAGFDREIAALRPEHSAGIRLHYVADPAIVARVMQAWALTLSGDEARADKRIVEAKQLIGMQEQSFSRIYGLTIIASIRQTRGEAAEARELATAAWQTANEERVPYWEAWAAVVRGWAMTATGETEEGLVTLREGLAAYGRTGARQMLPYGRTLLADACFKARRIQEGLSVIEHLEREDATNQVRFFDAERRKVADALRGTVDT
ncbi:SAM domain (Sterile alpha motif) [Mesorhizobium albiziae]|uniref:SAM domain (Sterile alpha motif) n=1 Tax=Neomesorhizobium albiziae TaxID=335020 RepID=A0A1I4FYW8_9HYPH|nr:AAA family ATPase [Mesorhizobium albiziae]GLS33031.1 adenylate cyclase [Mesorhizobium albiziae]SFL22699.1 SAM domain (Sterile alpha motif) [Mesorhizobium albiziae]